MHELFISMNSSMTKDLSLLNAAYGETASAATPKNLDFDEYDGCEAEICPLLNSAYGETAYAAKPKNLDFDEYDGCEAEICPLLNAAYGETAYAAEKKVRVFCIYC